MRVSIKDKSGRQRVMGAECRETLLRVIRGASAIILYIKNTLFDI